MDKEKPRAEAGAKSPSNKELTQEVLELKKRLAEMESRQRTKSGASMGDNRSHRARVYQEEHGHEDDQLALLWVWRTALKQENGVRKLLQKLVQLSGTS